MIKNELLSDAITAILSKEKFDDIFFSSLKCFIPSKRRLLIILLSTVTVFIFLSYFPINSEGIISVIELSNTIILALLALTVTGYAIFQALSSAESLLTFFLSEDKTEHINLFIKYQLNFFSLSIIYIALIILNFFILFISKFTKENPIEYSLINIFHFIENPSYITNICSVLFISIYFAIVLNSIIELKSFIFGIYQAFNISSVAKIISKYQK